MEWEKSFRHWFAEYTLRVALLFALIYQVFDMFINYFISDDLAKGFAEYYQSPGGKEDLVRFFTVMLLFSCFGMLSRNIILELRKAREDELARLNEIKVFAHSIMHDVKNPAIGVHNMAMLLTKKYGEVVDDQGKYYFQLMQQLSKDIVGLMELVNTFIQARECPLNLEDVNLQTEIDIIRENVSVSMEIRGIQFHQEPGIFPFIRGDRLAMHRIFRNLIDNALKYGGDGLKRILVEYDENEHFHSFSISDDGQGIDEYEQDNVFKLFNRAKTSKNVEGSGLGLAIVKELVEKHNGSIQMSSATGKGTAFAFTISKNL